MKQEFMKLTIYFFKSLPEDIFKFRGERQRKRNIDVKEKHRSVASCMPSDQGSNSQPRYVPGPGIEPATFWFMGHTPTN